jgi:DNA-binding MarR family transcriptional regulator
VSPQRKTTPKAALAADAWRGLFEFFMATRAERDPYFAKRGLTPNDAKALWSLDTGVGRPMGALALEWSCDASNATWIIDRLEKRGLAERRPSPGDRRVKMVVLTPLGAQTRDEMMAEMFRPPAAFLELDRDALEALLRAARKLNAIVKPPTAAASERPA